jgi:lipopolysaccharide transport system ATP-binding protein
MRDSDVVIRVEGLGKKYSLHHEQSERYTALRDVVARQAKAAGRLLNPFTLAGQLRKAKRQAAQEHAAREEEFWALKDVSFEIRRGERVGIIGRNGAGKSTLLKILSRIIEPSTGRVEIRGRVASLLEVGTGFHPELTGRENIYLNGAILGMTRREIRSKFGEIVDFAEVEKFLDTPVKRYSSGMYVRLAFAVAAHLEPEILVVDEVLAVGDSNFQQKCLGKMEAVSAGGRTILFVSHNMHAIKRLCEKSILIEHGKISMEGQSTDVLSKYLSEDVSPDLGALEIFEPPLDTSSPFIKSIEIVNSTGESSRAIKPGERLDIRIEVSNQTSKHFELILGVEVLDEDRRSLFTTHSNDIDSRALSIGPGQSIASCHIEENRLLPGNYYIQIGMVDEAWKLVDLKKPNMRMNVTQTSVAEDWPSLRRPGKLVLSYPWSIAKCS